jgi:hypothetical protein
MIKKNYRTKKSKKRFSKKSKKNMKGGTVNNEINTISVRELLKNININIETINFNNKKLLDKSVTYKIKKGEIIKNLFYEISKYNIKIYNEIKKELREVSIDKNANGDITTKLGSPLYIFEKNVVLEPINYTNAVHPASPFSGKNWLNV